MVGFRNNFSRCRYAVYLDGVQRRIPNSRSSFDVSGTRKSRHERKVEVTWRTLRTVSHSLMVHARVSEAYVHFTLMYTTDHIFPVLPIKYPINKDGNPTTPHKLETCMKPSASHLRVLFCPHVVRKATANVETKALNMHHQAQKGFRGIFVGIPEHQKGYLVYVPSTRKIIYSYDVVFDESFSNALAYMPRPYSEAMAMRPAVWHVFERTNWRYHYVHTV